MDINEIKEIINKNEGTEEALSLSDLLKLKKAANVEVCINRESGEYYYKVNLDNLVNKEFNINILKKNKWVLSPDEKNILLYI